MPDPMISRPKPEMRTGRGELLYDAQGKRYIDLLTANGTAWLGHAHPALQRALSQQAGRLWNCGALVHDRFAGAIASLDRFLPEAYRTLGFYSTGMEAVEFALRLARSHRGHDRVIGFESSMYGKSLLTASLGWSNANQTTPANVVRLAYPPALSEDAALARLADALESQPAAAVFVEPVQASHGCHLASPAFFVSLQRLCRSHQTLLVFDELLTGFYRTGPRLFFAGVGVEPDIVILGKALGNGLAVSAVVARPGIEAAADTLPGSTFANNPLAACVVQATLEQMQRLDLSTRVNSIGSVIASHAHRLPETAALRGRGALWCVQLGPEHDTAELIDQLFQAGVCIGHAGRRLRLLPPATISPGHLHEAIGIVFDAIRRQHETCR